MGERLNGIQEVVGSIPIGSTISAEGGAEPRNTMILISFLALLTAFLALLIAAAVALGD